MSERELEPRDERDPAGEEPGREYGAPAPALLMFDGGEAGVCDGDACVITFKEG
jgi:hypothetical protein